MPPIKMQQKLGGDAENLPINKGHVSPTKPDFLVANAWQNPRNRNVAKLTGPKTLKVENLIVCH